MAANNIKIYKKNYSKRQKNRTASQIKTNRCSLAVQDFFQIDFFQIDI